MRRIYFVLLLCILLFIPHTAYAYTITRDPQYVVINLASENELDWAAPESTWQSSVKPQIVKSVREIKSLFPMGTQNRKLAWSTLMEYMNFPMDTPGPQSVYVIKLHRILEIAEEENLPVFLPLNGFQWWDELPELYNWWDPDGTHTSQAFFARQHSPDFRERFIKGYNPENKWNVEWQDYETPMKLNWRNWGGGGFRLAPPPNILSHSRSTHTYRQVLEGRLTAILTELKTTLTRWQNEGKEDLFAGISLGTEVSLNASVTSSDEFIPYGYRAAQDLLCPVGEPTCGTKNSWTKNTLRLARQDALQSYLFDMSRIARNSGLPKQRVYTHVYADAYAGNPRFEKYADSAFTPFARPGISLYASATNPFSLSQWAEAMKAQYYPAWGALEFGIGNSYTSWAQGLASTFDNAASQAKLIDVYNLREYRGTQAIPAIAAFLKQEVKPNTCMLPEIIPVTTDRIQNPGRLEWRYVPSDTSGIESLTIHIINELVSFSAPIQESISQLPKDATSVSASSIPFGTHDWYIEAVGCQHTKKQFSEPRTITMKATFGNILPIQWLIRTLKRLP